MHLTVTRLDERRYQTVIQRRDGVSYHVKGVGHMFAIPHDMAHLAVEEPLGLHRGFWGSVADGAVFSTMTYLGQERSALRASLKRTVIPRPGHTAARLSPGALQGRGIYCRIVRGQTRQPQHTFGHATASAGQGGVRDKSRGSGK